MPIKIHELIVRVNVNNSYEHKSNKKDMNRLNSQSIAPYSIYHLKSAENSIKHIYDDKNER
jgi:hypothetical protein